MLRGGHGRVRVETRTAATLTALTRLFTLLDFWVGGSHGRFLQNNGPWYLFSVFLGAGKILY